MAIDEVDNQDLLSIQRGLNKQFYSPLPDLVRQRRIFF